MDNIIIEQGSFEWHQLRLGKFTASEWYRLMGDAKRDMTEAELKEFKEKNPKSTAKQCVDPTLLADGALTYCMEVASERATGKPAKTMYENDAMRWGKEYEPVARQLYAAVHNVEVTTIAFVPFGENAGASPDALIAENMGGEIKCPISPAIHMQYRTLKNYDDLKKNHPNHYWQCMTGLLATGREFWKFISYHPHYDPAKQLKVINVPRLDDEFKLMTIKLDAAEKEVQRLLSL